MHSQHETNPFSTHFTHRLKLRNETTTFDSEHKSVQNLKREESNDISSMGKHGDRTEKQPNQTPQFSAFVPNRRPKRVVFSSLCGRMNGLPHYIMRTPPRGQHHGPIQ
jgi:hypothetical protein